MQENNFEKEVRQKTSELKIKPSEEVWQKVAVAIGKRKKDRKVFAFVLLMLLFVGSALFIIWDKTAGGKGTTIKEAGTITINESKHQEADTTANIESDLIQLHKHATDSKKIDNTQPVTRRKRGLQTAKGINIRSNKTLTIASEKGAIGEDEITPTNAVNKGSRNKLHYKLPQQLSAQINPADPVDTKDESITIMELSEELVLGKKILLNEELVQLQYSNSRNNNKMLITERPTNALTALSTGIYDVLPTAKPTPRLKSTSSWKLGLNFSAGIAATRNGYLGIVGPGSLDESKALFDAQPSSGSATSPPTGISYLPSKISSGIGFSIGFYGQRSLSTKTSVLIGLNYRRLSSEMSIGSRVDSGLFYNQYNSVYRVGSRKNYHNHFNFIELPVSIHYRISKSHQLPVYLNTGISISQLLSSDALQFDIQSGNYYSNDVLFNKTQLNVAAGLLFALSRRSNNSLLVGPDINFSLTKMAATGLYKDRRYSYFGILLHKGIGKK